MINRTKMRCRQGQTANKNCFNFASQNFCSFPILEVLVIAKEEMRHTTDKHNIENKASNHVFGKCIFSGCNDSCMGTEIRWLFRRHMICNTIGD